MACHGILFKEKRLFKEKISVFGLVAYDALHQIVNNGFLVVGFQLFSLFLILGGKI